MAYKNKAKKKYISAEHVNELSTIFNQSIFLREDTITSKNEFIKKTDELLSSYESIKGKMQKTAGDANIKKFDSLLNNAINESKEMLTGDKIDNIQLMKAVDIINAALDEHRKKGDIVLTKAKNDMLNLFREVAVGNRVSYDMPWLRTFQKGEKFMSFAKTNNPDDRYVYKGFMNQAILGYQTELTGKGSVVVTKKELEEILLSKFEQDPNSEKSIDEQKKSFFFANLKGKLSLTSLFTPKKNEYYLNQDGTPWKSNEGRRKPTDDEIKNQNLKVGTYTTFISHPVWPIEDLKENMSDKFKESYENLLDLRMPKSIYFEKEGAQDLDEIVEKLIAKQIDEHKIESTSGGNRACYFPARDTIRVPDKKQFKNPVERYSVWVHELTHSTKHLLGRRAANAKSSPGYAFEELCAESTAFLMVKDLEANLKEEMGDNYPKEWDEMFKSCHQNRVSYNQSWGHEVGVEQLYKHMINELQGKNGKFNGEVLMGDIINSFKLIQTGKIDGQEITKSMRRQCLIENFKKLEKFDYRIDNDAKFKDKEPSSELTM